MSDQDIDYGDLLPSLDPALLTHQESRELLTVCQSLSYVNIIELRKAKHGQTVEDIIIADFGDGSVPSRNPVGIQVQERLALTYRPDYNDYRCPYDVRAIRSDFPLTPHQNHVLQGEPASLCLYFEPWSALQRTWTPQNHLKRVLWWLKETAAETLHRENQPLEQFYFASPWQVILPVDFHAKVSQANTSLTLSYLGPNSNGCGLIINGSFELGHDQNNTGKIHYECLTIAISPVQSGTIEAFPYTLGALHQQLLPKGTNLFAELGRIITARTPSTGLNILPQQQPLIFILLQIPRIREPHGSVERYDLIGFVVTESLASLGISLGVLFKDPENRVAYADRLAGMMPESQSHKVGDEWRNILILPVEVKLRISREYARQASGIASEYSEFRGILAGVGALGSCLAEIWSKEAWGNWTYVDDDILDVHNITRHLGKDPYIGHPKVEVVGYLTSQNYADGLVQYSAINAKINDLKNEGVQNAIRDSDLLVDVTTTLDAPRDLSVQQGMPRMASAFVTPSGRDSVLLLEDKERLFKLPLLEAQYYRAILQNSWGETHLAGHSGNMWVGAGCRDTSTIMSNELIQLHGAILARQIRRLSSSPEAKIKLWINHDATGCVEAIGIPAHPPITHQAGEWSIWWDTGLQEKLFNLRENGLPNETGGILLGYLDQKMKSIHLVDALPAPPDSIAEADGFIRGKEGLQVALDDCRTRTAEIVTYVGEWHSHPPGASVIPSHLDITLLASLSEQMASDGLPFLMMIVGQSEISFTL